jgi:hypothetical protein
VTPYGIKLVWAGWENDTVIGFSDRGYGRWKDDLKPGTRMLLYETATKIPGTTFKSTKSIIGEVEVTGTFAEGAKLRARTEQHDQLLPVKVIRPRSDERRIPLERVREIIQDDKWPRMGETWKPLSQAQYETLIREMEG